MTTNRTWPSPFTLIRPSATFSLREKGFSGFIRVSSREFAVENKTSSQALPALEVASLFFADGHVEACHHLQHVLPDVALSLISI